MKSVFISQLTIMKMIAFCDFILKFKNMSKERAKYLSSTN